MRKVMLWVVTSLDGYTEAPGGEFVSPEWSPDLDAWTAELRERADTLLFGRRTWEDLAQYWPAAEQDPATPAELEVARYMNATPKIVFSRTLRSADGWANSRVADRDPAQLIAELRDQPGRDIALLGSADTAGTFIREDLADEYCLLMLPRLFGGGTRLFADGRPGRPLRLLHQRSMDTGAVFLRYARDRVREAGGEV